jgi:hypothetical protein
LEYDEGFLKNNGFSETGLKRFKSTVDEFTKELFEKSVNFGKANQDKDMPLEITNDSVRGAAIKLRSGQQEEKIHPLLIIGNILEYLFTILATIGANNLDKDYGKLFFGIFTSITVILITVRLICRR